MKPTKPHCSSLPLSCTRRLRTSLHYCLPPSLRVLSLILLSLPLLHLLPPSPVMSVPAPLPSPLPLSRVSPPSVSTHRSHPPRYTTLYAAFNHSLTLGEHLLQHHHPHKPPASNREGAFLELHWADANFHDKVCRVHHVCLLPDLTLQLHPWMRKQETHLRACGIHKLKYVESVLHPKNEEYDSSDLFGIRPARYHIPHFVTDILPMLYAHELLRPRFSSSRAIRRVCEGRDEKRCPRAVVDKRLNPALLVDERVAKMTLKDWVPQMLALLPDTPQARFEKSMFEGVKRRCFKSVVAYNVRKFVRQGEEWFGEGNDVYKRHDIKRAVRHSFKVQGKCRVRVSVLNRVGWESRGGLRLGRDIKNVQAVVDALERRAGDVAMDVRIEYFENKTFAEQVAVMQDTDILVGVHGAGLGNIIFLRQQTPVIEVLPFAYYAGPFQSLAAAMYLDYTFVIAKPDTETFKQCLQTHKDKYQVDVTSKGMQLWNEAVKKMEKEKDWYTLQAHRLSTNGNGELNVVKICARTQRMQVNVGELVGKVMEKVNELCEK